MRRTARGRGGLRIGATVRSGGRRLDRQRGDRGRRRPRRRRGAVRLLLGFPAELAEGEIPVSAAVGAPFVPGVLLASQFEGIWNRGAAAMYQDPPDRVVRTVRAGHGRVPRGREAGRTPNGTDIAVGEDGTLHVVWAAADGVWYASGTDSFTADAGRPPWKPARATCRSVALRDAGRAAARPGSRPPCRRPRASR